jgi:nitrogen regulatory protein PII
MVKDKSTLPFEVTYSETTESRSKTPMKRLAVLLKPEKVDAITSALRALGLESTIYDVKGASKEKQRETSGRGTSTFDLAYTTRKVVATVVKSDTVDDIVGKMKEALGEESGAVVMISTVDDLVRL